MGDGLGKTRLDEFLAVNEIATFNFAKNFAKELHHGGEFVALFGGLGAGKTTFVKGLCAGLGFLGNVSSPTFALVHEYRLDFEKSKLGKNESFKSDEFFIAHCDMWRIETEDDLESVGFFDYLMLKNCVMVVEWSEKIINFLPKDCYRVSLTQVDEISRLIKIQK